MAPITNKNPLVAAALGQVVHAPGDPGVKPVVAEPAEAKPVEKAVLPDISSIPGSESKPADTKPVELPPESGDTTLPENTQKVVKMLRTHIKNLEQQLKGKTGETDPIERKLMQEQIEQLQNQIGELDLTKDPRFISKFETRRNATLSDIKAVLESYGADEGLLKDLQGKTTAEQIALLKENCPDTMQAGILGMLKELNAVDLERNEMLKNTKLAKEKLAQEQMAQQAQEIQQGFDLAVNGLRQSGSLLLREIPGNDEWNAKVKQLQNYAFQQMKNVTPGSLAEMALRSSMEPILTRLYQGAVKENESLKAELSAMGKVLPGASRSQGVTQTVPDKSKPMTAEEVARRIAARL